MSEHPLDLLISRLPKPPRKSPARADVVRAFRAECPCCGGRGMPLSLAETVESTLIHCFSGCDVDDILAALGMDMADLYPPRLSGEYGRVGNGGPLAWGSLAASVDGLVAAHTRLLGYVAPALQIEVLAEALELVIGVGEAASMVKKIARRMMQEGRK